MWTHSCFEAIGWRFGGYQRPGSWGSCSTGMQPTDIHTMVIKRHGLHLVAKILLKCLLSLLNCGMFVVDHGIVMSRRLLHPGEFPELSGF